MTEIEVAQKDAETFEVTVRASTTTTHVVKLTDDYYRKLTAGKITAQKLIEKSFEFLLEREPNTSILSSFDLSQISRYFPEYEKTLGKSF